jgi:hypothetical protein
MVPYAVWQNLTNLQSADFVLDPQVRPSLWTPLAWLLHHVKKRASNFLEQKARELTRSLLQESSLRNSPLLIVSEENSQIGG